ncbi:hypothetical protein GR28A_00042 [Vibrio phage vB_VcorM_GR28A]|nr:hypothetical protein GR28A_00042 [Vibrio phage vB_VcorM_GR28A]
MPELNTKNTVFIISEGSFVVEDLRAVGLRCTLTESGELLNREEVMVRAQELVSYWTNDEEQSERAVTSVELDEYEDCESTLFINYIYVDALGNITSNTIELVPVKEF